MQDALSGRKKVDEKDYGDIDCGCGQKDCPQCNVDLMEKLMEDDPCYMCMSGACSDCCENCSVTRERNGEPVSSKAGEHTAYGKRDIYGGL